MKKLLFAFPIVVLLAAGCNSSQQVSNQTTVPTPVAQNTNPSPTPTSTPTPTMPVGPMPQMTFTTTPSSDVSGGQDLNLFADGKKVATIPNVLTAASSQNTAVGVDFDADSSQKALFYVGLETGCEHSGCNRGSLDMLNLQNGAVTDLEDFNDEPNPGWTPDLKYVAYVTGNKENTGDTLNVINTDTGSDEEINLSDTWASLQAQGLLDSADEIKFSPDQSKVAIVLGDYQLEPATKDDEGPVGGTIYIVNLADKSVVLYQQSTSTDFTISGWKNNTDLDWSVDK